MGGGNVLVATMRSRAFGSPKTAPLTAWACRRCGHLDLFAAEPEVLFEHWSAENALARPRCTGRGRQLGVRILNPGLGSARLAGPDRERRMVHPHDVGMTRQDDPTAGFSLR